MSSNLQDNFQIGSLTLRANQIAQFVDMAAAATGFIPVKISAFNLVDVGVYFVAKLTDVFHGSIMHPKPLNQVI